MNLTKRLFTLLVLGQTLHAQITITSVNMPIVNDTARYSSASLSSVGDFTVTGANRTWDFSNLTSTSQVVRKFQSGISTPYAFYFLPPKYGEKIQDSIGVAAFKIKNIYTFYKRTTGKFSGEGIGFSFNGIPLAGTYADEDELYQFPLDYLDRDSSTFEFKVSIPSLGYYGKQGYRINEVDGWGTITTPYGTASCLRLVSTQYSVDSLGTPLGNFGFQNNLRSYQWLTTTEKIPFLEISGPLTGSAFTSAQIRYRDVKRTALGVKEDEWLPLLLNVFPNPSQQELTLVTAKTEESLLAQILDTQGKVVKTQVLDKNTNPFNHHRIDVSSLAKGLYTISLSDKNGQQFLKISIQ